VGDRHLKFYELRDNLHTFIILALPQKDASAGEDRVPDASPCSQIRLGHDRPSARSTVTVAAVDTVRMTVSRSIRHSAGGLQVHVGGWFAPHTGDAGHAA
jgi:hypothetical protein